MKSCVDMPLRFAVLTANCGNSTLGKKSCDALLQTLSDDSGPAFIVVHCQELHYPHQQEELLKKLPETLGCLFSALMPTYTKPTWDVIRGHTGIASLVLYNKSKIKALSFEQTAAQKVRGQNPN